LAFRARKLSLLACRWIASELLAHIPASALRARKLSLLACRWIASELLAHIRASALRAWKLSLLPCRWIASELLARLATSAVHAVNSLVAPKLLARLFSTEGELIIALLSRCTRRAVEKSPLLTPAQWLQFWIS